MKKSFFGNYFLYKLKEQRLLLILGCGFGLLGLPLVTVLARLLCSAYTAAVAAGTADNFYLQNNALFALLSLGVYLLPSMLSALLIIAAVSPLTAFRSYNQKPLVDTVGSLPLTYKQRFLGDALSGLLASAAPFALLAIPTLPLAFSIAQDIPEAAAFFDWVKGTAVSMLVSLCVAYACGCFAASCCGKKMSAAIYTVVSAALVPGVAAALCGVACANTVGSSAGRTVRDILAAFPPLGTFFFDIIPFAGGAVETDVAGHAFAVGQPPLLAIMLVVTAAFGAGAYFVGKYRKQERVGSDFVVETVYIVESLLVAAVVLCGLLTLIQSSAKYSALDFIQAIVLTAIVFFVMEIAHSRDIKRLPASLARFACVCVLSVGFALVASATHGFGREGYLPDKSEIASVEVNGRYIYSDYGSQSFANEDAVAAVIEEHELILSSGDIKEGRDIQFVYRLKSGFTVVRGYAAPHNDDEMIKQMSARITKLPSEGAFGLLSATNYTDLWFSVNKTVPADPNSEAEIGWWENGSFVKQVEYTVKPSESERFREILLNDFSTNYDGDRPLEYGPGRIYVHMHCRIQGVERSDGYFVISSFTDTLEFLADENNLTEEQPEQGGEARVFTVEYIVADGDSLHTATQSIAVCLLSTDKGEAQRELLSLIEQVKSDTEYSQLLKVRDAENYYINYGIRKENEQRAAELIVKILQNANDGV